MASGRTSPSGLSSTRLDLCPNILTPYDQNQGEPSSPQAYIHISYLGTLLNPQRRTNVRPASSIGATTRELTTTRRDGANNPGTISRRHAHPRELTSTPQYKDGQDPEIRETQGTPWHSIKTTRDSQNHPSRITPSTEIERPSMS